MYNQNTAGQIQSSWFSVVQGMLAIVAIFAGVFVFEFGRNMFFQPEAYANPELIKVLGAIVAAWFLPFLLVLFSRSRPESVAVSWLIALILFSWVALIPYLMFAPTRKVVRVEPTIKPLAESVSEQEELIFPADMYGHDFVDGFCTKCRRGQTGVRTTKRVCDGK